LISDLAMTDLFGSKIGINYRIKAHTIIQYLRDLKTRLRIKFEAVDGVFPDGLKWSFLPLRKVVEHLYATLRYKDIKEEVFFISFYILNLLLIKSSNQMTIRVSGDGRLSSSKTSFVLITITILLEDNLFDPEQCIAVAVYEGKESREKVIIFLFRFNLHNTDYLVAGINIPNGDERHS